MESIMISTIEQFLDEVEEYKGNHYFRGQANTSWDISPSIFRDPMSLASENGKIGETYSDYEHKRIFFKILEMQHYQQPTRLCDLSVNPLVALFFALDGINELDQDGCVYIINCSNKFSYDSLEIKIMTKLATSNITNILDLRDEIIRDFKIELPLGEIKTIISRNIIVNYGYEVAFSNPRIHLQGGTVIFFGFSAVNEHDIDRRNGFGISNIEKRLIIPSDKKPYFLNELQKRGIVSDVLYDRTFEHRMKSNVSMDYDIEIESVKQLIGFKKVIFWIKIADINYDSESIFKISNRVIIQMKNQYGMNSRIWGYVYFDIQDKRACNFICYLNPTKDFSSFTIQWNKDYHKRRMEYFNHQISAQEILERLDPIVTEFIICWKSLKAKQTELTSSLIDRDRYCTFLLDLQKKLKPLCYWDSNDIAHGGDKIYDYQESSHELIDNIMFLIEEQLMYLDRKSNDYWIERIFNDRNNDCKESYHKYSECLKFW